MDELLTEKELAERSKLSVQTLRNYRAEKKLFSYIKLGRSVRYPLAGVLRVLASNEVKVDR